MRNLRRSMRNLRRSMRNLRRSVRNLRRSLPAVFFQHALKINRKMDLAGLHGIVRGIDKILISELLARQVENMTADIVVTVEVSARS